MKQTFPHNPNSYVDSRPDYPEALFSFLAQQACARDLAWDCATGNGQAAKKLVTFFDLVVASDANQEQLRRAVKIPQVVYLIGKAEQPALKTSSVDLITVAQALHWFANDSFWKEVVRILKPGGCFAYWSYSPEYLHSDQLPEAIIPAFYVQNLKPQLPRSWHKLYENSSLPAIFEEISCPPLKIEADWDCPQLAAYLSSLGTVQALRKATGQDPLNGLIEHIRSVWPKDTKTVHLSWDLYITIGRLRS